MKSNPYTSFKDQAPLDEIYVYPIITLVVMT